MLRKLGVLIASLAMVLVSSLALVLVPATQAAATGGMGHDGRSTGDSPPGSPSPGGVWHYDPLPSDITVLSYPVNYPAVYRTCGKLPDGTIPTGYTIWWKAVPEEFRMVTTYLGKFVWNPSMAWNPRGVRAIQDRGWCYYPRKPDLEDVNCALSVTISATGPTGNPKETSTQVLPPTTNTSDWSKTPESRKDPDLCVGTVALGAELKFRKLGKYQMDVTVRRQACQKVVYGPTQPSVIKSPCNGIVNEDTKPYFGQQWCDGYAQDWLNRGHDFTMTECTRRINPPWHCNTSTVTLDGQGGSHAVMDDGKSHPARWSATSLGGPGVQGPLVVDWTKVVLGENSTPSRPGTVAQNSDTQPFQGVPGTGSVGGDQVNMSLRWHAPSMPPTAAGVSRAWTLTRSVSVKATFLVKLTEIESMDLTKDEDVMVTKLMPPTAVPDTVECTSAPLVVQVNRARNFR